MPKYSYVCDTCGHEYIEHRDIADPMWKPNCVIAGCTGKFLELPTE